MLPLSGLAVLLWTVEAAAACTKAAAVPFVFSVYRRTEAAPLRGQGTEPFFSPSIFSPYLGIFFPLFYHKPGRMYSKGPLPARCGSGPFENFQFIRASAQDWQAVMRLIL